MTEADRVLADCAAHPDDDGPRLVWADLVGGERGELVVVQCDLARGGLSPLETAIRRRRERELLAAHGVAWAGSIARVARQWRYRRGFVESIELELLSVPPGTSLVEHPLVSTLSILDWQLRDDTWQHAPTLARRPRGVMLRGQVTTGVLDTMARLDWLAELRAFGAYGLDDAGALDVEAIVSSAIEQLWLPDHRLSRRSVRDLLARTPNLAGLVLRASTSFPPSDQHRPERDLERMVELPLRALSISGIAQDVTAALSALPSLERLAIAFEPHHVPLAPSALQQLRALEIGGATELVLAAITANVLPRLQELSIASPTPAPVIAAVAAGTQLATLELPFGFPATTLANDSVGELVVAPEASRLAGRVTHVPGTAVDGMLDRHGTSCELSQRAWLVRVDRLPEIIELPPRPAYHDVHLGRGRDSDVQLPSITVARRHARLRWYDGRHHVRDLQSTNGTRHNGEPADLVALADGDELAFGEIVMRYFVGEGGAERAQQALSSRDA